jgi:hypothetical protein
MGLVSMGCPLVAIAQGSSATYNLCNNKFEREYMNIEALNGI